MNASSTRLRKKELIEKEVIPYLEGLRSTIKDVCHAYKVRQEARVVYLIDLLQGRHLDGNHLPKVKKSQAVAMRKALNTMSKLKPNKGRRRDIRKIEKLLDELEAILEE